MFYRNCFYKLILVLLSFIPSISTSSITLQFYSETSIKLELGQPKTRIIFDIDLYTPVSHLYIENLPNWINKSFRYIKETNLTFQTRHFDEIILSKECHTTLYFDKQFYLSNFFIFLLDKHPNSNPKNTLSLSFYPFNKDYKYSIIHQLYEQGIITNKLFAFYTKVRQQYISIGSIPKEYAERNYKGNCTVFSDETEWGCNISSVGIDVGYNQQSGSSYYFWNQIGGTRFISYLQLSRKEILIPVSHYSEITSNIFLKYVNTKKCRFTPTASDGIVCLNSFISEFQFDLKLEFDNMIMILTKETLFKRINKNENLFLLLPNKNHPTQWEFGFNFIKHFNIVFDCDKSSIFFYSDYVEMKQGGSLFDKANRNITQNLFSYEDEIYFNQQLKRILLINMVIIMIISIIELNLIKSKISFSKSKKDLI